MNTSDGKWVENSTEEEQLLIGNAIQQFTGFVHAIHCNKIISLVQEMCLTKKEWLIVREEYGSELEEFGFKTEIDEYFKVNN